MELTPNPDTSSTQGDTPARRPWVKPVFDRVPLNEALATFAGVGADNGIYS